jgi:hypothetical protein
LRTKCFGRYLDLKGRKMGRGENLHYYGFHHLYSTSNIVRVIKSRRMRWAGHVAYMGKREMFTEFWLGSPKLRDHWKDVSLVGGLILSWTLGR